MRELLIKFAVLTAVSTAFPALATPSQDKASVIKLEHALADAQTVEEIMKYYRPADSTVLFDGFEPGIYRGPKAIAEDFAAQLAGNKSIKVDFRELTVEVEGPLAVAYSVQHAVVNKGDSIIEVSFRDTDVLRKIKGRWYIVHQHISYPADPKTGKTNLNSPEK